MSGKPTKTVFDMAKLNITGNVIPNNWWSSIKLANGRPDCIGCLIMAEVCYWYRPKEERDEKTGRSLPPVKKFDSDKWQCSYQAMADKFGFSKTQIREAIGRLVKIGLIETEFRTVKTFKTTLNNVMFIEPVISKLKEITYEKYSEKKQEVKPPPPHVEHDTLHSSTGRASPRGTRETPPVEHDTYTEITTEIPLNTSQENKNNSVSKVNPRDVVEAQAEVMSKGEAMAMFAQLAKGKPARAKNHTP